MPLSVNCGSSVLMSISSSTGLKIPAGNGVRGVADAKADAETVVSGALEVDELAADTFAVTMGCVDDVLTTVASAVAEAVSVVEPPW